MDFCGSFKLKVKTYLLTGASLTFGDIRLTRVFSVLRGSVRADHPIGGC
jgi:hypothetical protein